MNTLLNQILKCNKEISDNKHRLEQDNKKYLKLVNIASNKLSNKIIVLI